ncbi:MAG: sigma-70 family RNA polymerase sigma factor [Actinomycetota bacterium]|nr:sigma-70 family RNA polymerase sigma factor [Actinomycetota bacterium]
MERNRCDVSDRLHFDLGHFTTRYWTSRVTEPPAEVVDQTLEDLKQDRVCRTYGGRSPTEEAALETDPKHEVETLYRAYADRVLRYAQRRVGPADAEEIVAQTFLAAWRRVHDVPTDPLPWLIGIARNAIRNLERADRRRSRLVARIASTRTSEEELPDRPDLSDELFRVLESLSADDREALLLVAWDELDHSEAAAAMGWSKANFRLRLHRARKRLRQRLGGDEPFSQSLSQRAPRPEEAR